MSTNVGVIFGGRSVEHKVSVVSARTVAAALRDAGYGVVPLGIAEDGCWVHFDVGQRALAGEVDRLEAVGEPIVRSLRHLLRTEVDAVFPIVHGTWGEDGTLQGLCEMLDLAYVGTGVASSAVCMDKALCKEVLAGAGLPVVPWETVTRAQFERDRDAVVARAGRFSTPIFVKPSVGGSSVGVRKVEDPEELPVAIAHALRFDERVVVEKGVVGRELECAVLGYGELEASGIGEIVPGKDFYDYHDKYIDDGAELILRADLPADLALTLRKLAIDAFGAVGGWGMARVDFLLGTDDNDSGTDPSAADPRINEINTLPGFTSISMYPTLWREAGLETPQLVDRLVQIALRRRADRHRLDDGIKDWITALG